MFVFGDFNIHHKEWLTYFGEIDRPGELCYMSSISNVIIQMVNSLTWIPDCDPNSPALLDLFLSSDPSICSTVGFHGLGNFGHVAVSVSMDFPSNSKGMPIITILKLIGMVFVIIFKHGAFVGLAEFFDWVQVGIDVYISHYKYQMKPHLSL